MPFKDFGLEPLTAADVNTYLMQQVIIQCTSGTRPGSPTEGWHIYETDTKRVLVFKSGAWSLAYPVEYVAFKPANTVRTTTSLTADADLQIYMSGNSVYILEGILSCTSVSAGFMGCDWTVPAGASMRYESSHPINVAPPINIGSHINKRFFTNTDQFNVFCVGTTRIFSCRIHGIVTTGATPGLLTLRWKTSGASTTLYKNSTIRLEAYS